jgi:hypothetical protein
MPNLKILLLSGGSLVGRNLLDVVEDRRGAMLLLCSNSEANEPSLFEFDRVFLSPPLNSQPLEFSVFFDELIASQRPDWIIPCRDEDVLFLAEKRENAPVELKAKYLVGPREIASSFLDKWKSYVLSEKLGLPFAKTILANSSKTKIDDFLNMVGLPVIAKPKKGFASRGVYLITHTRQVEPLIGSEEYILQEYLGKPCQIANYLEGLEKKGVPLFHSFEEEKISVQASIGPNGEFGGLVVTSHKMSQGISKQVELCQDESIVSETRVWVEKLIHHGWVGPLNIQCQKDQSGKLKIYEFNGRFTGATSGRYHLGYDELGVLMGLWKGKTILNEFEASAQIAVKRIPKSRSVNYEMVNELSLNGLWSNDHSLPENKALELILKS